MNGYLGGSPLGTGCPINLNTIQPRARRVLSGPGFRTEAPIGLAPLRIRPGEILRLVPPQYDVIIRTVKY